MESGSLKVERSGKVTAITGSSAHGQGHETTFAQVVADHLGVSPDDVVVVHGDTRSGPEGFGTFGSRSIALGGGALVRVAAEVADKGRRIAARLLEAAPADVARVEGGFQVVGVPQRRVTWREVAAAAYAGGAAIPPGDTPGDSGLLDPRARCGASGRWWRRVRRARDRAAPHQRLVWVDDAGTVSIPAGGRPAHVPSPRAPILMEQVYDRDNTLTNTLMDTPAQGRRVAVLIEKMHTPRRAIPSAPRDSGKPAASPCPPQSSTPPSTPSRPSG
jgi:carbon-monoxide dehydrogenase large subunit